MKVALSRKDVFIVLTLIIAAAFGLRIWGIWFGLPYSFRADEYHEVFRALELGTGSFNFERISKGGYFYLLFAEYGVLFVVLKLASVVDSAQDFARYFVRDQSLFYLLGRATTAVIGTLNVFLAYRVGARAYGIGAGLIAAAILSVDFLNAEHSHFITVDVPMTCLATAALLFAVRMVTEGRAVDYRWAALFAALATTTKLPAILLLVPLLIAHYYFVRQQGGAMRQLFLSRDLWWAALIFVFVLGATNPGLFINPPWHHLGIGVDASDLEDSLEDTLPAARNLFVYYFGTIANSLGWPLMIIALAGVLYAAWKRTAADVMLVSFAVLFYWVFASVDSHIYFPRYILPVIVVLALLAGRVLFAAWPHTSTAKQAAAVSLILVFVSLPAYKTMANNYLLTQTDTRRLAHDWFQENVPQGAKVMIEGLKIEPSRLTVPLRDTPSNMRANIEYYRTREPGKSKYLSYALQVEKGRTYDLELVKRSELQGLEVYKNKGVRYLVIRPEAFASSRTMGPTGRRFLDQLNVDPDARLLKSFKSDPASIPGPDIDIYEVQSDAEKRTP